MAEPQKPQDNDRIEELLSQLQGIFGKLSHSEEEESKQKIDLPPENVKPAAAAPETPITETQPPIPKPIEPLIAEAPWEAPPPQPEEPPPVPPTPSEPPMAIAVEMPASPPPAPDPSAPMTEPSDPASAATPIDAESTPAGIFFPAGREAEAKSLAQKLETLTPKFTKVTFRLQVVWSVPYDPKTEWRDRLLDKIQTHGIRTLFMIVDRNLDDARRRPLLSDLEARSIYFQEVPIISVEKKAFYTDLLLGLVFYFDYLKPNGQ
jgi:hypothetical protein